MIKTDLSVLGFCSACGNHTVIRIRDMGVLPDHRIYEALSVCCDASGCVDVDGDEVTVESIMDKYDYERWEAFESRWED